MFRNFPWRSLSSLLLALTCVTAVVSAQAGAKNGEWRTYGGDLGSTRYAPLDQINAANFGKLQVAWRFKTDVFGIRPDFNLQTTPLMINGVLYATAGSQARRRGDRRSDRRTAVDVPDRRRQARRRGAAAVVRARRRVLDRREGRRAHLHGDDRLSARRARSEDRHPGPRRSARTASSISSRTTTRCSIRSPAKSD